MAAEPRPCPSCGSTDTVIFPDDSGRCNSCGRAFLGKTPLGAMIVGEAVDAGPRARAVRGKVRWGLFGVVGGLLAYAAIPVLFYLSASLESKSLGDYMATVVNRNTGPLTCGGSALLIITGLYAIWAGMYVWRGFPEKTRHLILAGIFVIASAAAAGTDPPRSILWTGAVGLAGGALALLGGLMARRVLRAEEKGKAEAPPTAGPTS
ncbi:MAG: hypothetical protein HY557_03980 [Euryarchaeota archaeon]|nr:hypothetical protein [Euryarchaeota archaeon]